ncbi:MAG TPA: YraN family protein [Syntrophomonas sp.]|jgi:putative endonuclease|nr:YraN family protein [Syntrophomonas sp.]
MANPLGKMGEDLAVKYLEKKGYCIVERNYRTPYGEVDIICSDRGELVFVEVKTRRCTSYGSPEEAVTRRKKEHIKKTALCYLAGLNRPCRNIRFDVIAILIESSPAINHIQNAF